MQIAELPTGESTPDFRYAYRGCGILAVAAKTLFQVRRKKNASPYLDYLASSHVSAGGRTADGLPWGDGAKTEETFAAFLTLLAVRESDPDGYRPFRDALTRFFDALRGKEAAPFARAIAFAASSRTEISEYLSGETEKFAAVSPFSTMDGEYAVTALFRVLSPFALLADFHLSDEISGVLTPYAEALRAAATAGRLPNGIFPDEPLYSPLYRITARRFFGVSLSETLTDTKILTPYDAAITEIAALCRAISGTAIAEKPSETEILYDSWDDLSPFLLSRGKQRYACFLPHLSGGFTLSVLPSGADLLAKKDSLTGEITLRYGKTRLLPFDGKTLSYKGGFLIFGETPVIGTDFPGEGDTVRTVGRIFTAFAALPDDETALFIQTAVSAISVESRASLLSLPIPVADKAAFTLYYGDGKHEYRKKKAGTVLSLGDYCNIDGAFGICTSAPITLRYGESGFTLFSGETDMNERAAGETLVEVAAAMAIGGIRRTRALQETFLTLDGLPRGVRAVSAVAANRKRYTLLLNLSGAPFVWENRCVADREAVLLSWDR